MECATCGYRHAEHQLFVTTGYRLDSDRTPLRDETCQVAPARELARSHPQPPGAVAYHSTRDVESVLREGLDPARCRMACKHVCLASRPGMAASLHPHVLAVDISGMELFFEMGEARYHGAPIPPSRLRLLDPSPEPDRHGWDDPGWRRNHSDCLLRLGFPLTRRILRSAEWLGERRHWPDFPTMEESVALAWELIEAGRG